MYMYVNTKCYDTYISKQFTTVMYKTVIISSLMDKKNIRMTDATQLTQIINYDNICKELVNIFNDIILYIIILW